MVSPNLIKNRYEVRAILGRGGMGVVYKVYDTLMRREVALKTLRDTSSNIFVDFFYRECTVLSAMVHPNIIEIFDIGEYDDGGGMKPFFVMPFLPGQTLHDIIYPANAALSPQRGTDIVLQACRGLHAAHECGILHRDIKPRNIFVMPDDAVKLIDFGVVRLLGQHTVGAGGTLGTLHYMAPEQIRMHELTVRSDIFSLGTVCYETLTGTHPFQRGSDSDTASAVLEHQPPLASAVNSHISRTLAQVIARAMSKDPRHRFESAQAFGEAIRQAMSAHVGEPIAVSNAAERLLRAQRSFARADYDFANEILQQLEAEGLDQPEARQLRWELDAALKERHSAAAVAAARRYFEEGEIKLAKRRLAETLSSDPANRFALKLHDQIEEKLKDQRLEEALREASMWLEDGNFAESRRLLEECLRLRPEDPAALKLLQETKRREVEWPRQREEQEKLFQEAQTAYGNGRLHEALTHVTRLAELTVTSDVAPIRNGELAALQKRVRADAEAQRAALSDARRRLDEDDLEGASTVSEALMQRYGSDQDVSQLHAEVKQRLAERDRQFRSGIEELLSRETGLAERIQVLDQALQARPYDENYAAQRARYQEQLRQVNACIDRAQANENAGQFDYALEDWLCVRDIYPSHPGLKDQLSRLKQRWQEQRRQRKADLRAAVTDALAAGQNASAEELLHNAGAEFDGDHDYLELAAIVRSRVAACRELDSLLIRMERAGSDSRWDEAASLCRGAVDIAKGIPWVQPTAAKAITDVAARAVSSDWRAAGAMAASLAEIAEVPPLVAEPLANCRRIDEVNAALSEQRKGSDDLEGLRTRLAAVLAKYPGEKRVEERIAILDEALAEQRREDEKSACATELALMFQELGDAKETRRLWDAQVKAKHLAAAYPQSPEVARWMNAISEQVGLYQTASEALSRDRLNECFEICDDILSHRPGHQLFSQLKERANQRHAQLSDEYMARVERWMAAEPDVFERQRILERAQQQFPGEPRYREELDHIERELSIANSLAHKARDYDKRGMSAEALSQWRLLRNISPSYPGLDHQIAACEDVIERQQRWARAQRLLQQGREQLTGGDPGLALDHLQEAYELSAEIHEPMSALVPDLVAAARLALADNLPLAEALAEHARKLDDGLRLPKDLRNRLTETRRAQDLQDCHEALRVAREAGNFERGVELADSFLSVYPGTRSVETLRAELRQEVEQAKKQLARSRDLNLLHELEERAVTQRSQGLAELRAAVREIAQANESDAEVAQRASTVDSLLASLAEVRAHLEAGRPNEAAAASARALSLFPGHPLFKAGQSEAERQRQRIALQELAEVKGRLAEEGSLDRRAEILRDALERYPHDPFLNSERAALDSRRGDLRDQIEKARVFEQRHLFGEAIREWETIGRTYPWHAGVKAELERLDQLRQKEKQDTRSRWTQQVERAIDMGDFETATTMLRQAQQQQPDKSLLALEEKVNVAQRAVFDAATQFERGRQLLNQGAYVDGGNALSDSFRLHPNDPARVDSIVNLLLEYIGKTVESDFSACDSLLAHLKFIRPSYQLPRDLAESISEKRQILDPRKERAERLSTQIADLSQQTEAATSQKTLTAISKKLLSPHLIGAQDRTVRAEARELLGRVNRKLNDLNLEREAKGSGFLWWRKMSIGPLIVGILMVLALAGVVYFLTSPRTAVDVQISVVPEEAEVEMEGQVCKTSECHFLLGPGKHVLRITKDGYKTKSIVLSVNEGDSTPIHLNAALDPINPASPAPQNF